MHKPAQQTIVPAAAVPALLADLPLTKLRGLGANFGKEVQEKLGVVTAGALRGGCVGGGEGGVTACVRGERGVPLLPLTWGGLQGGGA